ncbi:MAG: hypothetical protein ACI92G_000713 [Candidatus Pelagisphaera sp.]
MLNKYSNIATTWLDAYGNRMALRANRKNNKRKSCSHSDPVLLQADQVTIGNVVGFVF